MKPTGEMMLNNYSGLVEDMNDGISLKELFTIIFRYRLIIGLIFFLSFIGAGIYILKAKPLFQASGQLHVTPVNSSILDEDLRDSYSTIHSINTINNFITRLRSSNITDSVIVKTNSYASILIPTKHYQKIQYFQAKPPVSTQFYKFIPINKTNSDFDFLVLSENGSTIGKGKYNTKFESPLFSIIVSDFAPLESFDIVLEPIRNIRARILSNLQISNIRDSDIIQITYKSYNPVRAKTIINGFMNELIYQNLNDKREKATVLKTFLENQFKSVSSNLESTENDYLNSRVSSGIVSLDAQTTRYLDLLRYLQERRIDYEIRLAEATASKEKATTILNGDPELQNFSNFASAPFSQNNTVLQELYSRVANLQVENARRKSQYNLSHPMVLQSNAELEAAKKELDNAISTTVNNATKGVDPLLRPIVENQLVNIINIDVYQRLLSRIKSEIANLNQTLEKLPKSELDRSRYERNIGINQHIYDLLLTRLEEARIMEASTISDVKVIGWAEAPIQPISPQKSRILLLALFAWLFTSAVIVFGMEHFKPSFNSIENVEKYIQSPVLALIPRFSSNGSGERKILVDPEQYAHKKFQPYEIFNSLLINLYTNDTIHEKKTLIITSTFPREGKSIIAANLAVTIARSEKKVLLIDCDFRKPVQHYTFNELNNTGFIDLIKTGNTKGFIKTKYQNLMLLPTGMVDNISISELLHDPNLIESIRKLETRFDYILIDTPPIMLYPDAIVFAKYFKNVLLVIKPGSNETAILRSRKVLNKAGADITGVVLNNVRNSLLFGTDYASYGYNYGYGYGMENEKKKKT